MFVSNVNVKTKYENDHIHKLDLEHLKKYNGVIVDYGHVQYSDLNIGRGRPHQSRVKGEIPAHISSMTESISVQGLQTIPMVEFRGGKYNIISGHHRVHAGKKLKWKDFPVALVKFNNPLNREHFMHNVQIHLPSKPHNNEDHISYLSKVDTFGEFDSFESETTIKSHARKLLQNAVGKDQMNKIVNEWFENRGLFTGVRTPNREEIKEWGDEIWKISSFTAKGKRKKVLKSGMLHPGRIKEKDTILLASCFNAINKALYNVMRVYAEEKTKAKEPRDLQRRIQMAVYADKCKDADTLEKVRNKAIKEYTAHNICFGSSALIEKVIILPQILNSGQQSEITKTLSWDAEQKKFV